MCISIPFPIPTRLPSSTQHKNSSSSTHKLTYHQPSANPQKVHPNMQLSTIIMLSLSALATAAPTEAKIEARTGSSICCPKGKSSGCSPCPCMFSLLSSRLDSQGGAFDIKRQILNKRADFYSSWRLLPCRIRHVQQLLLQHTSRSCRCKFCRHHHHHLLLHHCYSSPSWLLRASIR